jgi:hypothetical protein
VDQAVLAQSVGTSGDQPPERFADGAAIHWPRSAGHAP